MKLASGRSEVLFNVLNTDLSLQQAEALKFLFAYMPISDLADYSGEFFLAHVEKALLARDMVPWGKNIPEDIFLHYVLPYRVNNENLDSFRIVYFDELHERIKGLALEKAALEINYWSNEKVTYQPADIRTSSPMSTILSARGRCGEESTLTVSALRTAGIPARQVYTPRWAHVDDNHAWVEVWIDGQWRYMGACEPEAVLDRGWFTEYARRAMLVHTKSFGASYGNENVINVNRNFSEVNSLSKYAVTKRLFVKVLNSDRTPANGALVEYRLYNYSEFYPLTTVPADENGISSLETGIGDLLIWANNGKAFEWDIVRVKIQDTIELILNNAIPEDLSIDLDLSVPPIPPPYEGPPDEVIDANAKRLDEGHFIRKSYMSSWIKDDEVKSMSQKLNKDYTRTAMIFSRSMGNFSEVRKLLLTLPDSLTETAFNLLEVLPDKDLRDGKAQVFADHILNLSYPSDLSRELVNDFVLNPRVDNEMLVAWRSYFIHNLPGEILKGAPASPEIIVSYLKEILLIRNEDNYYGTPLTPVGAHELKVSDDHSREILFVAICRSLGIPSRLEPGRKIPQYWSGNKWNDVYFDERVETTGEKSFLGLITSKNHEPQYYTDFTLARFADGKFTTLEYEFNPKVSDFGEIELPSGSYMLVTGKRQDEQTILAGIKFFTLAPGEHTTIEVNPRTAKVEKGVYGKADIQQIMDLFKDQNISLFPGKSNVIIWFARDHEPSRHVFNDMPAVRQELNKIAGNFLCLSADNTSSIYEGMPENTFFSSDPGLAVLEKAVDLTGNSEVILPFIIIADNDGTIIFTSSGYSIGIGNRILEILDSPQ